MATAAHLDTLIFPGWERTIWKSHCFLVKTVSILHSVTLALSVQVKGNAWAVSLEPWLPNYPRLNAFSVYSLIGSLNMTCCPLCAEMPPMTHTSTGVIFSSCGHEFSLFHPTLVCTKWLAGVGVQLAASECSKTRQVTGLTKCDGLAHPTPPGCQHSSQTDSGDREWSHEKDTHSEVRGLGSSPGSANPQQLVYVLHVIWGLRTLTLKHGNIFYMWGIVITPTCHDASDDKPKVM